MYKLGDFNLKSVIGRGSFGKVFLAEEKKTKEVYALKVLKKLSVIANDDVRATMAERRILSMAPSSPFLAQLHASFQDASFLF